MRIVEKSQKELQKDLLKVLNKYGIKDFSSISATIGALYEFFDGEDLDYLSRQIIKLSKEFSK